MNKTLLLLFSSILFLSSCSNSINSDSEYPIIENLEVINLGSGNILDIPTDTDVQFSATFLDNQELGSYKFDIHFSGDGHKHTYVDPYKKAVVQEWNFTRNGDLNGTDHKITFTKKVDVDATAGPYHCLVYAVDEAGNSAKFLQKKFIITNEDMPTYEITEPDFTDLKVPAGGVLHIVGVARGVKGLSKLAYIVRSVDDFDNEDLIYDSELTDGSKEIAIDFSIDMPADTAAGNYALLMLASDKSGNVGEYYAPFEITN